MVGISNLMNIFDNILLPIERAFSKPLPKLNLIEFDSFCSSWICDSVEANNH